MYSFNSRIRYSETDTNAELTIESLINYFQDCSTFQTQDGPASMEYLKSNGLAWVLSSWQIEINRLPKLCEEVTIGTVPYEIKGYFGLRNFFMDTREGERLAIANSEWILFNFEKGIPAKVTPEIIEAYPVEERLDMEYLPRKIVIPRDITPVAADEIVVREHHLDTNNHVNNGQYVRMALGRLDNESINIKRIRAEYRKQARLGDILYPDVYKSLQNGNMSYTINLKDADGHSVCKVEFIAQ
ncbi:MULTISPECIES: acyl-[acyl-carrier-protein] thioesterase [unclassified Butyrivibrio]|uniref:acyl-[acyl-carrier-protein] thioesterase n=1 Tax=unclassified Butyrivibrio TaxID=2639466 RepID=UPI0003B4FA29|nr:MULTISPECIES: acyl-ACP thioesterase domain-containing protein [unclassified Butyrivibrio]